MFLRSAMLLCLAGGVCLAGDQNTVSDPFQAAIERAMPSPFSTAANATEKAEKLDLNQLPSLSGLMTNAPSARELAIQANHVCAIPLLTVPVSKSKDFAIRRYEIPTRLDDGMAKPTAVPACSSAK